MLHFINKLLQVSQGDITSLNLSKISQNKSDIEEFKIVNNATKNLEICKNNYAEIYVNVGNSFQSHFKKAPDVLIEKKEDDLRLNIYSSIDLKNELNT